MSAFYTSLSNDPTISATEITVTDITADKIITDQIQDPTTSHITEIYKPTDSSLFLDSTPTSTIGNNNVAVGKNALDSTDNVTSQQNTAVGVSALTGVGAGGRNIALGYNTGIAVVDGSYNTLLGTDADVNASGADNRTAIGYNAVATADDSCQIGDSNVNRLDLGGVTLANLGTTANSVFLGTLANAAMTGVNNYGIGSACADSITSGNYNVGIGGNAGAAITSGTSNICISGLNGGNQISTGSANIAIGTLALDAGDVSGCIAIGQAALGAATGNFNTAIGYLAGNSITSGANNTCIGNSSDAAATLDNQIAIGYQAVADKSNQCMIGNASITEIVPNASATCDLGVNAYPFNDLVLKGDVIIQNSTTPASASATGTTGTIAWDASYLYVCTATNTWRRVAHGTW